MRIRTEPDGFGSVSSGRVLAGALCLVGSVQYLLAEAVSAAGWAGRSYSYGRDYISDLGVRACSSPIEGVGVCSPLSWVMNTGFVLQGLLFIAAALLLAPLLDMPTRAAMLVLAFVHGVGTIVVGLVPASNVGMTLSGFRVHVIGAAMAIVGGNLAVIVAGWGSRAAGARRLYVGASLGLGVLGLLGAALLEAGYGASPGLLERIAVDTITVWNVLTGALLIMSPPSVISFQRERA